MSGDTAQIRQRAVYQNDLLKKLIPTYQRSVLIRDLEPIGPPATSLPGQGKEGDAAYRVRKVAEIYQYTEEGEERVRDYENVRRKQRPDGADEMSFPGSHRHTWKKVTDHITAENAYRPHPDDAEKIAASGPRRGDLRFTWQNVQHTSSENKNRWDSGSHIDEMFDSLPPAIQEAFVPDGKLAEGYVPSLEWEFLPERARWDEGL